MSLNLQLSPAIVQAYFQALARASHKSNEPSPESSRAELEEGIRKFSDHSALIQASPEELERLIDSLKTSEKSLREGVLSGLTNPLQRDLALSAVHLHENIRATSQLLLDCLNGDYSGTPPKEKLIEQSQSLISNDLAKLNGLLFSLANPRRAIHSDAEEADPIGEPNIKSCGSKPGEFETGPLFCKLSGAITESQLILESAYRFDGERRVPVALAPARTISTDEEPAFVSDVPKPLRLIGYSPSTDGLRYYSDASADYGLKEALKPQAELPVKPRLGVPSFLSLENYLADFTYVVSSELDKLLQSLPGNFHQNIASLKIGDCSVLADHLAYVYQDCYPSAVIRGLVTKEDGSVYSSPGHRQFAYVKDGELNVLESTAHCKEKGFVNLELSPEHKAKLRELAFKAQDSWKRNQHNPKLQDSLHKATLNEIKALLDTVFNDRSYDKYQSVSTNSVSDKSAKIKKADIDEATSFCFNRHKVIFERHCEAMRELRENIHVATQRFARDKSAEGAWKTYLEPLIHDVDPYMQGLDRGRTAMIANTPSLLKVLEENGLIPDLKRLPLDTIPGKVPLQIHDLESMSQRSIHYPFDDFCKELTQGKWSPDWEGYADFLKAREANMQAITEELEQACATAKDTPELFKIYLQVLAKHLETDYSEAQVLLNQRSQEAVDYSRKSPPATINESSPKSPLASADRSTTSEPLSDFRTTTDLFFKETRSDQPTFNGGSGNTATSTNPELTDELLKFLRDALRRANPMGFGKPTENPKSFTSNNLEKTILLHTAKSQTASRGRRPQNRSSSSGESDGHRSYSPGDDSRRIDWKASARSQVPVVRTFRDEQANRRTSVSLVFNLTSMEGSNRIAKHADRLIKELLSKYDDIASIRFFAGNQELGKLEPKYYRNIQGNPQRINILAKKLEHLLSQGKSEAIFSPKKHYYSGLSDVEQNFSEITLPVLKLMQSARRENHDLFIAGHGFDFIGSGEGAPDLESGLMQLAFPRRDRP